MKRFFFATGLALVGLFAAIAQNAEAGTLNYEQTFGTTGTQASDSGSSFANYSGWTYYESASDVDSYATVASTGTLSLVKGSGARTVYATVSAASITGQNTFTNPTTVSADLTGVGPSEYASNGTFHVGIVFGDAEFYFHPGYSGGAVRMGPTTADSIYQFFDNAATYQQGNPVRVSVTVAENSTDSSLYNLSLSLNSSDGSYSASTTIAKSYVGDFDSVGVLMDGDVNNGPYTEYVSNFSVSTVAVPEPGTLALTFAGVVGLLAYAWRKRK
jgi:hypothetical protein